MKKVSQTILLVDKTPALTKKLEGIFKREGYKVDIANDGLEALNKFKKEQYDLVLTGILMEKLDGFELCKEIKALNPNTPVVLMSIFPPDVNISQAAEAHASDVLQKPVGSAQTTKFIKTVTKSLDVKSVPQVLENMVKEDIREYIDNTLYLFNADKTHKIELHMKPRLVAEAVEHACIECKKQGLLKKTKCQNKECLRNLFAMSMNYGTEYVNMSEKKIKK